VFREGGPDAARTLVARGAALAIRLARFPAPVVIGCTGHALAMGAVLLTAVDLRIGAQGEFKIGYNEVAIGMSTPIFLMEFARDRISKRHLLRATAQAEIYGPSDAVDAGLLDRVVDADQLFEESLSEAARLAKLPRSAFVRTRSLARGVVVDQIESTLESDLAGAFPAG
jgi:enoyl-CoA hydratase